MLYQAKKDAQKEGEINTYCEENGSLSTSSSKGKKKVCRKKKIRVVYNTSESEEEFKTKSLVDDEIKDKEIIPSKKGFTHKENDILDTEFKEEIGPERWELFKDFFIKMDLMIKIIEIIDKKCVNVLLTDETYERYHLSIKSGEFPPCNLFYELECLYCSYTWAIQDYDSFVRKGSKCKPCAGSLFYDRKEVEYKLEKRYEFILEYTLPRGKFLCKTTDIKVKCIYCEKEWKTNLICLLINQQKCECFMGCYYPSANDLQFISDLTYNHRWFCEQKKGELKGHDFLERKCLICNKIGNIILDKHLLGRDYCSYCLATTGEKIIMDYLESKLGLNLYDGISLDNYYKYDTTPKDFVGKEFVSLRADFLFCYKNRKVMVEYDGEQHFKNNIFNKYERQRSNDIKKTKKALELGYFVIRIAYNADNIERHIDEGLRILRRGIKKYYFSDVELYRYILEIIDPHSLEE